MSLLSRDKSSIQPLIHYQKKKTSKKELDIGMALCKGLEIQRKPDIPISALVREKNKKQIPAIKFEKTPV
jgi:hypothetical protein